MLKEIDPKKPLWREDLALETRTEEIFVTALRRDGEESKEKYSESRSM